MKRGQRNSGRRSPALQHVEVGMMMVGHNSRELLKLDIMEEIIAGN